MMSFSNSAFATFLRRVAQLVSRHRRWFIYPQIVLAILGVLFTAHRLKLDMNRDDLVGARMKYHRIFMTYQKEFPGENNTMVVVVESGSPERNRQFIERLAARVHSQTNLLTDLYYKGDLTTLGPKGLLLAPEADLQQMQKSLRGYRPLIRQFAQVATLNSLFASINAGFRSAFPAGTNSPPPLLSALPFLQRIVTQARHSLTRPGTPAPPEIESLFAGGVQAMEQMYLTYDHGRLFLLTVRPRGEAQAAAAIEWLRGAIGRVQLQVPGVNVGLTGGPVLDYDEMNQAKHDSIVASLVALVLCSLIFIVAYREMRRPLKAALCLLVGLGYALGFATLAVGHLNILTITFAPMLIGLAIDFGIHFATRFEEEKRRGRSGRWAVHKATVFTGQGIVTGAFTTAAAYLAMALTDFKGIREMGIICGGGLLLCLVPMMTALPALLLRGRENSRGRRHSFAEHRVRIENLWLQRPFIVLAVTGLFCAGAVMQFHHVHFDYDLLDMQSQQLRSVIYEKKLIRLSAGSSLFGAVMADSLAQARQYESELKALPAVSSVESAANFLGGNQARKLALVRGIKQELASIHFAPPNRQPVRIEPLSATLWYLTGYLGLAVNAAQKDDPALAGKLAALRNSITRWRVEMEQHPARSSVQLTMYQGAFFHALRRTFEAIRNQDTSGPMQVQDLPPFLRHRFIGVTGEYLLQVYARGDLWRHDAEQVFLTQLKSVVPANRVTGTPVQLYEYTTLLKNSYLQAAIYATAAIAVMVLLLFRSFLSVLLALLPVAIGTTWLLGFMGLAGIPFNPANIMTLPLVVGIGVTNGIQILNRFAEEQKPGILARSTGKAVLVSGLTALSGFGSLVVAKHQGIRSLGIVMAVGIAACMVAALALLPVVLHLLTPRKLGLSLRAEDAEPARHHRSRWATGT